MSQEFGVGREKKVFLSRLAHQRRKKQSIDRLKYAKSIGNGHGLADREPFMQALTNQGRFSLTGYVGQGYVDPFHTRSVPMNDSMNMYFHHCTSFQIAMQKAMLTTMVSLGASSASYYPS
jgi:hypothetical protein